MNAATPPIRHPAVALRLLYQLLAIRATDLRPALSEACTLLADAFQIEKVDCFLYDDTQQALVALGTSATPLGARQQALGLDVLPLAYGGRAAWVFLHTQPFLTGHSDTDPEEHDVIKQDLGVRSSLLVPLLSDITRQGVLSLTSMQPERFTADDYTLAEACAQWMNMLLHRLALQAQLHEIAAPVRLPTAEETITHLTQECLRLRSEVLYWQHTADTLLMELHRFQLHTPAWAWPADERQHGATP
jgi:two-component system, OmpR family, sensor kinase